MQCCQTVEENRGLELSCRSCLCPSHPSANLFARLFYVGDTVLPSVLPQILVAIVATVIAVGLSQYTGEYELTGFAAFHSVFGVFLGFVVRTRLLWIKIFPSIA